MVGWAGADNCHPLCKSCATRSVSSAPIPTSTPTCAIAPATSTLTDRCKMQDNLEFLQWMKKFWDSNSRGEEYNALERTYVSPPHTPSIGEILTLSFSGGIAHSTSAPSGSRNVSSGVRAAATRPIGGAGPRAPSAASAAQVQLLNGQIQEMQATCEGLEKERDFYFASEW